MKSYLLLFLLSFIFLSSGAQESLVTGQNPNYLVSQKKYMQLVDSLQSTMNTTVQETYKAYDWYEEKQERKQTRFNTRQEVRINRSLNYYNWNNGFNNDFRYNNWNTGCRNRFSNSNIGYRTGNWWFWF